MGNQGSSMRLNLRFSIVCILLIWSGDLIEAAITQIWPIFQPIALMCRSTKQPLQLPNFIYQAYMQAYDVLLPIGTSQVEAMAKAKLLQFRSRGSQGRIGGAHWLLLLHEACCKVLPCLFVQSVPLEGKNDRRAIQQNQACCATRFVVMKMAQQQHFAGFTLAIASGRINVRQSLAVTCR